MSKKVRSYAPVCIKCIDVQQSSEQGAGGCRIAGSCSNSSSSSSSSRQQEYRKWQWGLQDDKGAAQASQEDKGGSSRPEPLGRQAQKWEAGCSCAQQQHPHQKPLPGSQACQPRQSVKHREPAPSRGAGSAYVAYVCRAMLGLICPDSMTGAYGPGGLAWV